MLHNIMPIFTFMGASILRQDSLYSFQIITKTIDTIIPPLIQVCVRWRESKEGGGEEKEIGKGCVDRRGEGEQTLSSSPAVEGFYMEINGIKQILVSLEVEIFADQHIQNPLKSASGGGGGGELLALFAFLS